MGETVRQSGKKGVNGGGTGRRAGAEGAAGVIFAAGITAILEEAAPEAIHVVHCDEAVAGTRAYEPGDAIRPTPHGGGGTAFRPMFDWIARSHIRPFCAVYLTDLYGSEFSPTPEYPVLLGQQTGERLRRRLQEVIAYR